jgi:hypothetical protein
MPITRGTSVRDVLTKGVRNRDPGLGGRWMQSRDECLMFWARQALLDGREHSRDVTPKQRSGIKPQTRKTSL